MGWKWGLSSFVFFLQASLASAQPWMDQQAKYSTQYLLENIAPPGAAAGSVVASPSRSKPDYFYHWVRDAALVMSAVVELYRAEKMPSLRTQYEQLLKDYISFSRKNQTTPNPSDSGSSGRLGEPKFHADGTAFTEGWGRPQNDGPALRAITLIKLARIWMGDGRKKDVEKLLYDGRLPTSSPIKEDLEFVAYNWMNTSYDIWEEVSGKHFYTLLAQRRALVEGAALANDLGDSGAADFYRDKAGLIEKQISKFWDAPSGLIIPTRDRDAGIDYKKSNIDTAVLLAILHTSGSDGYYSVDHNRVISTFEKTVSAFEKQYPVNHKGYSAVALGRYPEDHYDGLTTSGSGNPWFLITAAAAEYLYRLADCLETKSVFFKDALNEAFLKRLGVTIRDEYRYSDKQALVKIIRDAGDAFLSRVGFHAEKDGHLSEQIHRDTGYSQGAPDLSWSYASFLTAYGSR